MTTLISLLAIVVVSNVAFFLWYSRKRVCPECRQRAVRRLKPEVTCSIVPHRCDACGAEFVVRPHHQHLISKQAYEAGAREPIPTATATRRSVRGG